MQDTLLAPPPRSFSVNTALVAGSIGAVAMFVLLAAAGMLDGDSPVVKSVGFAAPDNDVAGESVEAASIFEVRRTTDLGTVSTAALALDDEGNLVTMSATAPDGSTILVETPGRSYDRVTVVGYDPTTHIAVLAVHNLHSKAAPIENSQPAQNTVLVQSADPSRHMGVTVKDETAVLQLEDTRIWGLIAIESMNAPTSSQALMSKGTGSIVGLIVPFDDNPNDNRYFAMSAAMAVRVGEQLIANEPPDHGVISNLDLSPSEKIVSVGSTQIEDHDDLISCLMGYSPGDSVTVEINDGVSNYRMTTELDSSEDK